MGQFLTNKQFLISKVNVRIMKLLIKTIIQAKTVTLHLQNKEKRKKIKLKHR